MKRSPKESSKQTRASEVRGDPVNAFCTHGPHMLLGKADGPLSGLRFGAKDLLDVQDFITGCGSPDWLRTHQPARQTAPAIRALLDAGATLVGKTQMDELAYSLNGENIHYGTPINVRAPDRIPGGSSSGSAAAVAAHLVDFALGTDTGGSVRIPASYCGVYGIRPTHGRLSQVGCMPFGPSFDTVGWFADTARVLAIVGEVLFKSPIAGRPGGELLVAADLFNESNPEVRESCRDAVKHVHAMFSASHNIEISREVGDWANAFRILLAAEAWRSHRKWITDFNPDLGPDVRARFSWASTIDQQQVNAAAAVRKRAIEHVGQLLGRDRIIVMPTAPCPALPIKMPREQLDQVRGRIQNMTSIATLCGLPQVSLPLRRPNSLPVGLSLLGPRHSDEALLGLASLMEGSSSAFVA